ncbi:adenylyltransferase/cytidyltransferase family protein [Aquicoccus sp. G2-2]|uniref:adenylyltransferase/cytidyltransferase family protein n=1 Tax=Aquicoccus sp. G2-2 TaxID=3092120 RepID=UPI002AE025CC|nr:adenylyltransferase/cytidyltransferase family protein [Aquicoccus sp. G2-2]MEA1114119.1 adenylyltransferase/cytidyltransferase family protein [Aquicoccus sp. G2-2]
MPEHDARIGEIREAALAHLLGSEDAFDPKAHHQELEQLGPEDDGNESTSYLEARILTLLGFAKRPRRAQKMLYRLFRARLARQEGAEFEAFQQALREAGENGVSLDGLHFFDSFATLDEAEVWADIGRTLRLLNALVGPTFVNSGTLLGVVREKGLIAHDDDVDLAVILNAGSAREAADEWLKACKLLHEKGLMERAPRRNLAVIKLVSDSGVKVDLFPGWIEDKKIFVYPHTFGELAQSDVLPLAQSEVKDLPIPRNPEAMLAVNYGPDWRVPDAGFEFPWDRANRLFAAFRERLEELAPNLRKIDATSVPKPDKPRVVITYGTFDLFHVGHLRLLERLAAMGDKLIVACSTDEFNRAKGKATAIPFEQRCEMLKGCRYVDQVIAERSWEQKVSDIAEYGVSLFAMGSDWEGKFDDLREHCDVLYLPRTENVSTTELKNLIQTMRTPQKKAV